MERYFLDMLLDSEKERVCRLNTLQELEALCLRDYAELPALAMLQQTVTYQDLWDRVARMRTGLVEAGLQKGSRIGIALPNCIDAVVSFLAVTTAGGVAAMLPAATAAEALEKPCMLVRPEFVITYLPEAPFAHYAPAQLMKDVPTAAAGIEPGDPAAAFFTGGTSGIPKSAILSHRAMMLGAFNGIFAPNGAYFQRYYALIPFTHVFGTIRNMLTCLQTGSTLCMCTGMMNLLSDLQQYKPTLLVLVPALTEMLLGMIKGYGIGAIGGCVKTIIVGSAPIRSSVAEELDRFGITLCAGYGLTETANLVSGNGEQLKKPFSVGKPYPGQEIRFVDGEIQIRGEHIFDGYLNNPAETAASFKDGWFCTGDLGYIDEDGYLYITGRIKSMLILPNGEKVSPEEPEQLVNELPQVKACLVKMAANRFGAEVLTCEVFAAPDADEEALRAAILEGVNAKLSEALRIRQVIFRKEDFPRTASMKIVRNMA